MRQKLQVAAQAYPAKSSAANSCRLLYYSTDMASIQMTRSCTSFCYFAIDSSTLMAKTVEPHEISQYGGHGDFRCGPIDQTAWYQTPTTACCSSM